jgi:hypothetical protein
VRGYGDKRAGDAVAAVLRAALARHLLANAAERERRAHAALVKAYATRQRLRIGALRADAAAEGAFQAELAGELREMYTGCSFAVRVFGGASFTAQCRLQDLMTSLLPHIAQRYGFRKRALRAVARWLTNSAWGTLEVAITNNTTLAIELVER